YSVTPNQNDRIEYDNGHLLYQAMPAVACRNCPGPVTDPITVEPDANAASHSPRVMDERVHYLMISMLKDVVTRGTGQRALVLNRDDLAGKKIGRAHV